MLSVSHTHTPAPTISPSQPLLGPHTLADLSHSGTPVSLTHTSMLSVSHTHSQVSLSHTHPPSRSLPLSLSRGPTPADILHTGTPVSLTHTPTHSARTLSGLFTVLSCLSHTRRSSRPTAPNPARAAASAHPRGPLGNVVGPGATAQRRPGRGFTAGSEPPASPALPRPALGLGHPTTQNNPQASPRKPAALTRRTSEPTPGNRVRRRRISQVGGIRGAVRLEGRGTGRGLTERGVFLGC